MSVHFQSVKCLLIPVFSQIIKAVERLNEDPDIHGIIVQVRGQEFADQLRDEKLMFALLLNKN